MDVRLVGGSRGSLLKLSVAMPGAEARRCYVLSFFVPGEEVFTVEGSSAARNVTYEGTWFVILFMSSSQTGQCRDEGVKTGAPPTLDVLLGCTSSFGQLMSCAEVVLYRPEQAGLATRAPARATAIATKTVD